MRVHRLVVDESHLIAERGGRNISSRLRLISTRERGSSGTPFSTSLDQLEKQSMLLGSSNSQGEPDLRRLGLGREPVAIEAPSSQTRRSSTGCARGHQAQQAHAHWWRRSARASRRRLPHSLAGDVGG